MKLPMRADSGAVSLLAALGFLCACGLQMAAAAEEPSDPALVKAQASWRADIGQIEVPADGCFHASYPNLFWQRVTCGTGQPRAHFVARHSKGGAADDVGNGNDYVAAVKGLITVAHGTFSTFKGVTSEKSVGVSSFGGGGILGPNEYTLQLNTNYTGTTDACRGHSGCVVWQQYIYSTDYVTQGEAAVFMQYWLIGWGHSACPGGFGSDGEGDCYGNSNYATAPDLKAEDIGGETLVGSATAGGSDTVKFTYGGDSYAVSGKDTVLDIATVWKQAEFNVLGDAGGSLAEFNQGVSAAVKLFVLSGTTSAPSCLSDDGTTGETNNLNLGGCSASSGASPAIKFTETN